MDWSGNCILGIATQTMARDRKARSWRSVFPLQYGYIGRQKIINTGNVYNDNVL